MRQAFGAMLLVVGLVGVALGFWLIHREYLASRLQKNYADQIVDGRISERVYDSESLLAWRDVAVHFGVLTASLSVTVLGARRCKRRPSGEGK